MPITSPFVFAVCRDGSEKALKANVKALHGDLLTPAYMRPQLITWKATRPLGLDFTLDSPFARASGLSLGNGATDEAIVEAAAAVRGEKLHLHVYPREHPEDGLATEDWQVIEGRRDRLEVAFTKAGFEIRSEDELPAIGDLVLDVILEDKVKPNALVGAHKHTEQSHPLPGALPTIMLPPEAPSRAYLKMEQAIVFAGLDAPGKMRNLAALELGCAPGGATLALLRRGVRVCGVDPGPMDARVLSYAQSSGTSFTHLKLPVGDLHNVELPGRMNLLITDMNLAPPVVIHYLESVQRRVRASVMMVTLKLNDKAMETRLPDFLERLRRFAPLPFRVTQLPANRSEICVIAGKL